ncbi:MAG: DUF2341 domain-containing protein [Candidatus Rokubacteria bacterium]|nr:DUF2341 domain-containing protein [Candidatus Rokubacteria bacterium]
MTITAPPASIPQGYSLKVTLDHAALVAAGKSLASGQDVRVVYWNGAAHVELDRILAPGSSWNTSTTTLWFKAQAAVSAGAPDDNHALYYGNTAAGAAPASGDSVFLLWDDFQAAALNAAKWVVLTSGAVTVTVSNGQVKVSGTTDASNQYSGFGVRSVATFTADFLVESSFSIAAQGTGAHANWKGAFGLGEGCASGLGVKSAGSTNKRIRCWNGSIWVDIADSSLDAQTFAGRGVGQALTSDGVGRHYEDGVLKATRTGLSTAARTPVLRYGPDQASQTFDVRFDNVLVRMFLAADASISVTLGAEVAQTGNPAPTLGAISPTSAVAGGAGFTLTATGSSFVSGSVVRWNGADRTTSFVSATQLQATIPATDLANPGTAQVTVFTPTPGGGTSAPQAFTITSAATTLAITSVNGGANPTAGAPFSVVVTSQNPQGGSAAVATATGTTLSLKTGTGTLGGTLTGTIPAGTSQVTISGVTYTRAESGVVFTATRTTGDALTPGDSAAFTVNAGPASALAFTTQPANAAVGGLIPGPPTVAVRDSQGNTVTTSTASITVAIGTNPGGGTLSGTATRSAASGVASFSDLSINNAGTGYTLTATAAGLAGATSNAFSVGGTGTISGSVSRGSDGRAVGGATVEALQGGTARATDVTAQDGTYSLPNLAAGTYDVRASADGYLASSENGVVVTGGATATVNLSLTAGPLPGSIAYLYDRSGRLVGVVDPAGETAVYSYDPVGNLLSIARRSSSVVSIIDFSPGSGAIGATVRIYGTGFSATASQNTVSFNGVTAALTSSTATEIVTAVPSGATSGPIAVTAPSGSATSSASFIVGGAGGAPTISGFSPGIATAGTPLTINGTNFDPAYANNKARFNITLGTVTTATASSLGTSVPSSTGSGRISVTTPGGMAVSSGDLFIPPSPYTPPDVVFTSRMGNPGNASVTIGTASKIALVVFDGQGGQPLNVSMTGVTIPQSTVTLYSPTGAALASMSVSTGGGSFPIQTLPGNGSYTILVAPTSPYTGSMTLAVGTPPDLVVVAPVTVPTAPVLPNADGSYSVPISWTVQNTGMSGIPTSASWTDRVYVSVDAVEDGVDVIVRDEAHVDGLAGGASYASGAVTVTVPASVSPGSYYIIIRTDVHQQIAESDEGNNTRASATQVTLAPRPDLVVTSLQAPGSVARNGDGTWSVPVLWAVQNVGTTPTPAYPSWWDRVYLSTDTVLDGSDIGLGQVYHADGLAAGATYQGWLTVTVPGSVAPGSYSIIVKTDDPYNDLIEADETNNTRASGIQVTLSP